MPDELYTQAAHWTTWIIPYFFLGGIAGGSYFIAALLDLVGDRADRSLSRIGYLIAFPAISLGLIMLVLDLNQRLRFWHMMLQNNDLGLAFKWWSPISYGTWVVSAFSFFSFVSFLAALVRPGDTPQRGPLRIFSKIQYGMGLLSKLFVALGAFFGLWVSSYTGVLISVTNRPIWANSPLFGFLFLVSGLSTAAAAMYLFSHRRRSVPDDALHRLTRFDDWSLGIELVVLVAAVASLVSILGGLPSEWLVSRGLLLGLILLGVVVGGIIVPLVMQMRNHNARGAALAAMLVLIGGFFLRAVVVLSSETLERPVL